ncbi:hypothetical protein BTVI_22313 [Pitangus sulphuratus]|nr:hypothetical protein BTVI_22313 [Pitangus sulphuratus]
MVFCRRDADVQDPPPRFSSSTKGDTFGLCIMITKVTCGPGNQETSSATKEGAVPSKMCSKHQGHTVQISVHPPEERAWKQNSLNLAEEGQDNDGEMSEQLPESQHFYQCTLSGARSPGVFGPRDDATQLPTSQARRGPSPGGTW